MPRLGSSARLCAVLFSVLLLPAAAAGSEPSDAPLRELRFLSDTPVDTEGLRRLMPFRVGAPVTLAQIEEARRRLELKGIFRRVALETVREAGETVVLAHLERKRVIDRVRVRGRRNLSDNEVHRLLRLRSGMIYEPELLEAARSRLHRRYVQEGFPDVQVDAAVNPKGADVDVTVVVREGKPLTVAAVAIEGDVGTLGDVLAASVAHLRGKRRTRDARRQGERRVLRALRSAGYYEARVQSAWEEAGDHAGILRFRVDRGPRIVLDVQGNRRMTRRKLLGLLDLQQRLIVTDGSWRELAREMARAYHAAGFYRAAVSVEISDRDPKVIRFMVREGRRYTVRRLAFTGNTQIADRRLRAQMNTRAAGWFPWPRAVLVDDVLDDDLRRLWFFYRRQGFATAEIADLERRIDDARGAIDLTVVIEEGPRTIVRGIRAVETEKLRDRRLRLRVKVGEPLNPDDLEEDRRAIVGAFRRAGYPQATAEATIERTANGPVVEAVVEWHATPGPRQEVGAIVVQGNIDTRDRVVLRELPFRPGDPLNSEALLEGQSHVYRLGLFRTVSVRPITPESESVRDVGVEVVERAPGILQWGAGYNTRDGLVSFGEVAYENLGGMARRIGLRGQFSLEPTQFVPNQYLANLGFREPRLLDSMWRFQSNLIAERSTRTVDQFSIQRLSLINGVDRRFRPRLEGGLEVQAEQSDVFDVASDAVLSADEEGALRTIAVTPFLTYDGRDDALAPHRGVFESLRWRYGLPALSTLHFAKASLQHSQYFSLASDVVLLYSARLGWARAFGDRVPIRERFFLGGRTTVRGFSENSIGPRGKNGSEIGGDLAINLNLELRFPLPYRFGGAVFIDGGGLYLQQCDRTCRTDPERPISDAAMTLENFRRSAGLGLRYLTPVGPINLDYGIKLDRRAGEDLGQLHFSIGGVF